MKPRRAAAETPGTTPPGGLLALSGCSYPDSVPVTVGPFEATFDGNTYRTEPTILLARRVSVAQATPPRAVLPLSYQFSRSGSLWKVVFEGGQPFYLMDTLGARYLDYLLHEPNQPISAPELEVLILPEKRDVRPSESVQPKLDAHAKLEYQEALPVLHADRQLARKAGDRARVRELDREIKAVRAALKDHGNMADSGERARDNVRKALGAVKAALRRGGPEQKAFAEHLERQLSTGYECLYSHPNGRVWS